MSATSTKEASRLVAILIVKALIVAACWRIEHPYFWPTVFLLWEIDSIGWTVRRITEGQ